MQQTWFRSLDWEYPLEKEMETHSNILAWGFSPCQGSWNPESCVALPKKKKEKEKNKVRKKKEVPWWLSGEESTCQCGRHGFIPGAARSHMATRQESHELQLLSLCSRVWGQDVGVESVCVVGGAWGAYVGVCVVWGCVCGGCVCGGCVCVGGGGLQQEKPSQ